MISFGLGLLEGYFFFRSKKPKKQLNYNSMKAWFIMKNDEVVGSKTGYLAEKAATLELLKIEINDDEYNPNDYKIVLREFEIVFRP